MKEIEEENENIILDQCELINEKKVEKDISNITSLIKKSFNSVKNSVYMDSISNAFKIELDEYDC